jgi:nucleoside-diphosphate-sugar epimerase
MFVFGTGFVGRYVSERLLAQGWLVTPLPFFLSSVASLLASCYFPIPASA